MSDARVPFALALSAFGVSATVTPLEGAPVQTQIIWDASPPAEEQPYGTDIGRREQRRRVVALPRNVLAEVARGTLIVATESDGEVVKTWRVDGLVKAEWDCWRVFVVPAQG